MILLKETSRACSKIRFSLKCLCLLVIALTFVFNPCVNAQTNIPLFRITSFGVQSNVVDVGINSSAGGVYTLQALNDLHDYWVELTNQPGSGLPLTFSAAASSNTRFYRVAGANIDRLTLFPAIPVIGSNTVSLPDVVLGTPYSIDLSPVGTGSGPYSLAVSNALPDGVSATIISNHTGNALIRLAASGTNLVDGQRRRFTVTVSDNLGTNFSRQYDLRVVTPPPVILSSVIVTKANATTNIALEVANGTEPLTWSLLSGTVPDGLTFTNGSFVGAPTPDAAELNENGLYTNVIRVADAFIDRVTGQPSPRSSVQSVTHRVRLSYRWNLHANRPHSPSFGTICTRCHGQLFSPNFASEDALSIIYMNAGSGGECSPFYYYVLPGDPYDSLIVQKIIGPSCGERMPLGGPYLDGIAINRVVRWISELTDDDVD